MHPPEQLLQRAATGEDSTVDEKEWPRVLDYILSQLDANVALFPNPLPSRISSDSNNNRLPSSPPRPVGDHSIVSSQESQTTNKENAPPHISNSRSYPWNPATRSQHDSIAHAAAVHTSIRDSLKNNFPTNPPHTIQRLAELILEPQKHYRFLPSYLNALDRVVSVSSTTTVFPLTQTTVPGALVAGGLLVNGTTPSTDLSSNNTDDGLGGARLTRIPWLQNTPPLDSEGNEGLQISAVQSSVGPDRDMELQSESTEMVEGPNGAGSIETVSVVNGGIVPAGQASAAVATNSVPAPTSPTADSAATETEMQEAPSSAPSGEQSREAVGDVVMQEGGDRENVAPEPETETPHARGPPEIGVEDTGPQPAGTSDT